MRIVVLGSSGQLGAEFSNFLNGRCELYGFTHSELDITDFGKLSSTLKEIKPDVVINCAAYTKVDKAEEEVDTAYKVNVLGAKNAAFSAYQVGAKIVYFSTDYVFDGAKKAPYTEFDSTRPLSVYGRTKLLGERFTKEFNPNHLILRVSWLYGINRHNFVKTVVRLSKKQNILRIVSDQRGTPTCTKDVVKQTLKLLDGDRVGLYHSSNAGETTWFEFAKKIVLNLGLKAKVFPIKTEDYPALAERPRYSVLGNYLLELEGVNIMRKWDDALKDFLDKHKEQLLKSK